MVEQPQIIGDTRKAQLIAELEKARGELARNIEEVRNDLDLLAHTRHSVVQHKSAWLSGAAMAGWVFARLLGRRRAPAKNAIRLENNGKERKESAGVLLATLGALFKISRPILTAIATRKISEVASRKTGIPASRLR